MSYDHWKTTEPPDSAPWQECAGCQHRGLEADMLIVDGDWLCGDCLLASLPPYEER